MPAIDLTEEILAALRAAAAEIARLSGPDNVVCRRLQALQRKWMSQSVTVGELARRIDVSPRDVLDAAMAAGVRPFWHEGEPFRDAADLQTYLRLQCPGDPVPEIEFRLTPDAAARLAEELSVPAEELLTAGEVTSARPAAGPRKFVSSESHLPEQSAASRRREQFP